MAVRRDGHQVTHGLSVVRPPSAWTSEDAKQALWGLIQQLDAHIVCRIDLKPGSSPAEWILEVEADTGQAITQPLALSSAAAMWLEACRFTLPGSRAVQ